MSIDLNAPADLQASVENYTVHLSWVDTSYLEVGNIIERRINSADWDTIGTTPHNVTQYTDDTLAQAEQFVEYRVRAYAIDGGTIYSPYSDVVSIEFGVAAPTSVTVTVDSETLNTISWEDESNVEIGYEIYRKIGNGGYEYLSSVDENTTVYTDINVFPGYTYTYKVRSKNSLLQYSSFTESNIVQVVPSPPSDLVASYNGSTVSLNWSDRSSFETGFIIERSKDDSGWLTLYQTIPNTTSKTDDYILTEGSTYNYRVKAYLIGDDGQLYYSTTSNESEVFISGSDLEAGEVLLTPGETVELSVDYRSSFIVRAGQEFENVFNWYTTDKDIVNIADYGVYCRASTIAIGQATITARGMRKGQEAQLILTVTKPAIEIPAKPSNVQVISVTDTSATISWSAVGLSQNRISHFEIYRVEDTDSDQDLENLINPNHISRTRVGTATYVSDSDYIDFTDTGLEQGKSYYYLVVTVDDQGQSSLYQQDGEIIDYEGNGDYISVSTNESIISIVPSKTIMRPESQKLFSAQGINLNTQINWELDPGTSLSEVKNQKGAFTTIQASDKTVSQETLKASSDIQPNSATATVIIASSI